MKRLHHDTLAPSSIPAILQCACFRSRGDDTPQDDDYADTGTQMHEYVQYILKAGQLPADSKYPLLEQADREDCSFVAELIRQFCQDNAPDKPIETEVALSLYDDELNLVTFGHGDVCCAHILGDIKSGLDFCRDHTKHIPQVDTYALCNLRRLGFDKALCFIAFIKARKLIPYWRTFDECAATVECAVARRDDPNRQPQPCEHCKFCQNLCVCPATAPRLQMVVETHKELEILDLYANPDRITSAEDMTKALTFSRELLKPYLKRLDAAAKRIEDAALFMSETKDMPYYVRVIESGRKTVGNPEMAFQLLGMETTEFMQAVKVSLPDLAKVYAQKNGMTEKDGRKQVEGLINTCITTGEAKAVLEKIPEPKAKSARGKKA
jgi:hypothetical protein